MFFDPDLIVPDEELSIKEGAIEPWERRNNVFFHQILDAVCTRFEIDQYAPWNKLPQKSRALLLDGAEGEEVELTFEKNGRKHSFKREFEGVLANLRRRFDFGRQTGIDLIGESVGVLPSREWKAAN